MLSCAVAVSVAIVLPWKDFFSVITLCLPAPYLSKEYLRAVLIAASFASAPELQKKTFLQPVRALSASASRAPGEVK